jgi:hypothetical protein
MSSSILKVESIRNLKSLLDSYENLLEEERLRSQVQALIPIYVYTGILGLGDSLFPQDIVASPWSRLLHYFLQNQNKVINQDELTIVAGDKRWENYVRDLTRKFGWPIINGITAQELIESGEPILEGTSIEEIRSDAYILLNDRQDRDAAFRWYIARRLRKKKKQPAKAIHKYFLESAGHSIFAEEIRFIANDNPYWAQIVWQLRRDHNLPIFTRATGGTDLRAGYYSLEGV